MADLQLGRRAAQLRTHPGRLTPLAPPAPPHAPPPTAGRALLAVFHVQDQDHGAEHAQAHVHPGLTPTRAPRLAAAAEAAHLGFQFGVELGPPAPPSPHLCL